MTRNKASVRRPAEPRSDVIETLQSLVVAFVLAMAFRGFVLEGFVIPTGSMAPTLMGQHIQFRSDQTGYDYAVDGTFVIDRVQNNDRRALPIYDPMIGPHERVGQRSPQSLVSEIRMGDRILVMKALYPFFEPDRFDVVVFKNPTDSVGEKQNYIKRLVGLPNEKIWLVDGDVFVQAAEADAFQIQRKPEHVQRAVWQTVHHSDYVPVNPDAILINETNRVNPANPWYGEQWDLATRTYATDTADPTELRWNRHVHPLTDWTAYDMMMPARYLDWYKISDLRVKASVRPAQDGFRTTFQLTARRHVYEFELDGETATVRYRAEDQPDEWIDQASTEIDAFDAGELSEIEFWHVDQTLATYINGERITELAYEWGPKERFQAVTGREIADIPVEQSDIDFAAETSILWSFAGSPVEMQQVEVSRDLFYRPPPVRNGRDLVDAIPIGRPFELGPDHFFMLGDNSAASLDGRIWGDPDEYVSRKIDDAPNVVHRKLLLGKAWSVYFPAPLRFGGSGGSVIPDFGRIRFIR